MLLCPKDLSACCDDLCRGSGCMRMGGYPMLVKCDVCKGFVDEEEPSNSSCVCDDYEDYPE